MDDGLIPVETEEPPKERVKLTHNIWAKVGAIVLLYVFALCFLACAACFLLGAYGGILEGNNLSGTLESIDVDLPGGQFVYDLVLFSASFNSACVPVGIVLIALVLACLIFLFCAAGHRKGETELRLNMVDRIPLDIYAAAVVIACIFIFAFCTEYLFDTNVYNYLIGIQLVLLALALGGLAFGLVLALLLSFATRVKCGKWWRNTIIYRVLRFCWRIIKAVWHWFGRVGRMIPIVWRTALIMAGLYLVVLSSAFFIYGFGPFWIFVLIVLLALIYAAAIFGAWQMKGIKKAGQQLAEGNFNEKIDTTHMYWEFKSHAENLNSIGDGLAKEVAQRMKSERLKTELITNVSHDIKTPLTSIINYVDLLQKAKTEEERAEYLAVLDRQSHRLKKLTEDLVEASKASTGNMNVNLEPTNTQEIINQSFGEYSAKLEAGRLNTVISIPEPVPVVMADGRLLWRVIDNLFNNVVKYALPETRVYVDVRVEGSDAVISMKNISRAALNVSVDELLERFVRGDASRTTEGSGLGLNIAKSLTELQHGTFSISTDGDLFKAEIRLPLAQ